MNTPQCRFTCLKHHYHENEKPAKINSCTDRHGEEAPVDEDTKLQQCVSGALCCTRTMPHPFSSINLTFRKAKTTIKNNTLTADLRLVVPVRQRARVDRGPVGRVVVLRRRHAHTHRDAHKHGKHRFENKPNASKTSIFAMSSLLARASSRAVYSCMRASRVTLATRAATLVPRAGLQSCRQLATSSTASTIASWTSLGRKHGTRHMGAAGVCVLGAVAGAVAVCEGDVTKVGCKCRIIDCCCHI